MHPISPPFPLLLQNIPTVEAPQRPGCAPRPKLGQRVRTPLPGGEFHPAPRAALSDSTASAHHSLHGSSSMKSKGLSELTCSFQPVTSPLCGNFGLPIPTHSSLQSVSLARSAYKSCWFFFARLAPLLLSYNPPQLLRPSALPRPPTGLPLLPSSAPARTFFTRPCDSYF